jgi:beta-glucosidase
MRKAFLLAASLTTAAFIQSISAEPLAVYQDAKAPLEQRVEDLFGRLNQDEKLGLLGGTGFTTQPIPRLGVPAMSMADAGQGVRGGADSTLGPATAFPSGVLMAATWDTNLIWQIGQAIGEEAHNKGSGIQVELGPAVNIHRTPLGGRNAEYLTEDPYLAARLAVSYIRGMQTTRVAACVKHFAGNNQETDRFAVNEDVGERALREIYLPAFEAAVKEGKVWSVMSAYNKINDVHCSANRHLLTEILKQDWQFDGLVMSDWGGVHETAVVQAGNDLEMPNGDHMSVSQLRAALASGSVTQAAVDDSVHRILRTVIRVGLLDGPMTQNPALVNSSAHSQLAYQAATEGIVLLKNDGDVLPLDRQQIKSIAVIGEPSRHLQIDALGSPGVLPLKSVEILDGIKAEAGDAMAIHYAAARSDGEPVTGAVVTSPNDPTVTGFQAEYFGNVNLEGNPAVVRVDEEISILDASSPATGISGEKYSARWSGKLHAPATGNYTFSFRGDDGFRVFVDGKLLINGWSRSAARTLRGQVDLEAGKTYDLRVEFFQDGGDCVAQLNWQVPGKSLYADALAAAKESDVAIVCVSTLRMEGEGHDRPSMDLPGNQAALIKAVSAVNKKTIVILNAGTPVTLTNWLGQVPALVEAWFPGQEGGSAVAAVLFGKVNPSGKLPDTFAASRADYPDALSAGAQRNEAKYAEGIYVGYRHFDQAGIQPVFPFGYGLSYTTFKYSGLNLSTSRIHSDGTVTVTLKVENTGKRAGEEVVQLYVHETKPQIDRPVRELKGFTKVGLEPKETKTVSFTLRPRDLAYYDVGGHQWKADAGEYQVEIGASSRDIRLTAPLQLQRVFTEDVHRAVAANSPLPRSTPEAQGISSQAILGFVEALNKIDKMDSFMVLRHGCVIADGWWQPGAADQPHILNSVSKSFNSTAVGLAIAEGKLSLDDPVLKFFPNDAPADPSKNLKAMTVRDLLTMSGGHDTEPKEVDGAPSVKQFLAHDVVHKPGSHFLYNTMGAYVLSAIVSRATGEPVLDFLKPRLFAPLGINHPKWNSSPEGYSLGGYGLYLCTEDVAKFGQLYLQNGKWNGQQLISKKWIQKATRKQVPNKDESHAQIGIDWQQGYGFQFWRCRHNAYRGDGAGGQFCVVMPDQDVVVALTAGGADMQAELNAIWDHLLNAVQAQPLPEDAAGRDQVNQLVASLKVHPAKTNK